MTAARTAQIAETLMGQDAPPLSDEDLADTFADRHEPELRYVAKWGRWYRFTDTLWQEDDTLEAFDRARTICREAAAGKPANRQITSAKTVAAVERMAKADRRLAATVDQWDRDPWLLNTPDYTVDLRTGATQQHLAAQYITKQTAVAPGGSCPLWLAFLKTVTNGDDDLMRYLQRLIGYGLTGSTKEQILAFLYGTGANGKSVFLNTVGQIGGKYHRTAPTEIFMASQSDRHPTELAMLRGARLVTSIETEEGRKWAESRIKSLTGGDPIAARFMRQDYFEYQPEFKLLIAGNHKPSLNSVDEAIRRRLHLIPFTVTIPEAERDENLPGKLKAEWPGILQWAIDGAVIWNSEGLNPPASVLEATAEYLESEDSLAQWIGECCLTGPNVTGATSKLYASWQTWCDGAGEKWGTKKAFGAALEVKDFERGRDTHGNRAYVGIAVQPD